MGKRLIKISEYNLSKNIDEVKDEYFECIELLTSNRNHITFNEDKTASVKL